MFTFPALWNLQYGIVEMRLEFDHCTCVCVIMHPIICHCTLIIKLIVAYNIYFVKLYNRFIGLCAGLLITSHVWNFRYSCNLWS